MIDGGDDGASVLSDGPRPSTVFMNEVCFLGALIGLCSIFLPWAGVEHWSVSLADVMDTRSDEPVLACALYLTGTLLALLFPIGGFIQLAGLLMFYRSVFWLGSTFTDPSYGFFVAVASCIMVLTGFVRPTGSGYIPLQSWWSRRTETSARVCVWEGRVHSQRVSSFRDIVGIAGNRPAWTGLVAVLLVIAIVLAGAYALGFTVGGDEREYAHVSSTGVIIEFENLTYVPYFDWSSSILTLGDGTNQVSWDVSSGSWGSGVCTSLSFEERNLSGLTLFPIITDSEGDGHLSVGDYIVFSVNDGESFTKDRTYSAVIRMPSSALDLPRAFLYIDFAVLSDDEIESDAGLSLYGEIATPDTLESGGLPSNLAVVLLLFCFTASVYYSLVVGMRSVVRKRRRFD